MHYFIVNPVAGNGLAKKVFEQISAHLNTQQIGYQYAYSQYAGHATELARAAKKNGLLSIIAIGGDGTVLEVASGLFYSDCSFGVIPGGTGNDFIKTLNIPSDPIGALNIILNGQTKIIDAGLCDDKPFLNSFGTGLDAHVVIETNKVKKVFTGSIAYIIGIFLAFITFKPKKMTLDTTDLHIEQEMMFLTMANGSFIGGGINIAPQAILNDGYLDISVIDKISKLHVLKYISRLMKGDHKDLFFMHKYKTKSAHITSTTPLVIQIDGEILMKETVDVSIQEKALKVYVVAE